MKHSVVLISSRFLLPTDLVERMPVWNISSPGGKRQHIKPGETDFDTTPALSIEWMSVCSRVVVPRVSVTLPLSPSWPPPSFFCSGEFPQLFHLFHCYLGIATRENNASSCFALAKRHPHFLLCCNISLIFAGAPNGKVKVRFMESRSLHGWCYFFTLITLCNQYLL